MRNDAQKLIKFERCLVIISGEEGERSIVETKGKIEATVRIDVGGDQAPGVLWHDDATLLRLDRLKGTITVASKVLTKATCHASGLGLRPIKILGENEIDVSESSSDATIWLTVTVVCPLADPEEAVIVAVPLPTEVTRPDGETVAIE